MNSHIFFHTIILKTIQIPDQYADWLKNWLKLTINDIENGDTASSICLQGIMTEYLLNKHWEIDWVGVLEEYLRSNDQTPLAYSEVYGERLHKFQGQWLQSPIHAIHSHWYIEKNIKKLVDHEFYAKLIESHIQKSGWIYNISVSPTNLRTRMKSEYLLSMAMGVEILKEANRLTPYKDRFSSTLSSQPLTDYLGSEYFRCVALDLINCNNLMPVGLEKIIRAGEAGEGYCDFSVESKRDDYMGVKKRTSRDNAVHSPISSIHAMYLNSIIGKQDDINNRLIKFKNHLMKNPFDIPAFQMRDIEFPFGTDITPLELIAASYILSMINL